MWCDTPALQIPAPHHTSSTDTGNTYTYVQAAALHGAAHRCTLVTPHCQGVLAAHAQGAGLSGIPKACPKYFSQKQDLAP